MIELRFYKRRVRVQRAAPFSPYVVWRRALQYRQQNGYEHNETEKWMRPLWTDWQDVPTVTEESCAS